MSFEFIHFFLQFQRILSHIILFIKNRVVFFHEFQVEFEQ